MPTIEQIRAARALLGWSQSDLADRASLSQTGIARIENGTNKPNSQTLNKIETAFDKADVEFIDNSGVRKRTGEIRTLRGAEGLRTLLDDIFATGKEKGGEFCLHNARPDNWIKILGQDWFSMHSERMATLRGKVNFKITAEEGNKNLISSSFAEYRWFPKELFDEHSIYAYDDKLAFVSFNANDELVIRILNSKYFTQGFKVLFNIAWDRVAIKILKD